VKESRTTADEREVRSARDVVPAQEGEEDIWTGVGR
jgi:hypothetical protein